MCRRVDGPGAACKPGKERRLWDGDFVRAMQTFSLLASGKVTMIVVGLTGGIGSGKSTVARFFKEIGAVLIDADELAHDAIRRGGASYDQVVAHFGERVLTAEGEIDRKRLGRIVFNDPAERHRLNQIIHPWVLAEAKRREAQISEQNPAAVVIFEVPLLIESGAHREVDRVVVVRADRETRIHRLGRRDGLSPEEANKRIGAQMPEDERILYADYVVETDRPLSDVRRQVEEIYRVLRNCNEITD